MKGRSVRPMMGRLNKIIFLDWGSVKMAIRKADIDLSFSRFLVDTKDDFFPDPLNYKDLKLKKKEIIESVAYELNRILSAKSIGYSNYPFLEGDAPKSNNVVRHTIALHPFDRLIYSYIVTILSPLIEPALSKARDSHPLAGKKSNYMFGKRQVEHWFRFRSDLKEFINNNQSYKYVVSTDIACYFEYIHITYFKKQLQNLLTNPTPKTKRS